MIRYAQYLVIKRILNRPTFIAATCSAFFFIFGCQETQIDPYETETGIFSIYGAINLHEYENAIRVRDLRTFHNDSSSINLDATVTFLDIEHGTSEVLADSIVRFPASYTHNFILKKDLASRSPYKIIVKRSDGESVSSIFTMPGITKTEINPTSEGVSCYTKIDIVFKNVSPGEQIRWFVSFQYQGEFYSFELSRWCDETYDPERNQLTITESTRGLLYALFPPPGSNGGCGGQFPEVSCADLDIQKVFIRYLHLGPEWQNVYPVRAVDPVEVGDVENGLGFLGGFREDTLSYKVFAD